LICQLIVNRFGVTQIWGSLNGPIADFTP